MFPSYYNVEVPLDTRGTLLYNTYYQSLVLLDPHELDLYRSFVRADLSDQNDESVMSPEDGEIVASLRQHHFLLEDPETEADWLRYEFEKYKHNNKYLELTILPTLDCNLRCPYCYEKKRPGKMSQKVQDALINFVKECYGDQPFSDLRIVWYGGEPLTQPDIIEALSERLHRFCEENDVHYHASLMTNGVLADKTMEDRMKTWGITSVQVSFGGEGHYHDRDRVSLDGSSTFDRVYDNACRMGENGLVVHVECVMDRDNLNSCLHLANDIGKRTNIYFHKPFRKADYYDDLFVEDENGGIVAMYDYLTPKEMDEATFSYFMAMDPTADQIRDRLRPLHHYCGASLDRFYVIDELGYAYKCIVDVDKPETHSLFNICDDRSSRTVNWENMSRFVNEDPLASLPCRTCRILPICNAGCCRTNNSDGAMVYRTKDGCKSQMFKYTIGKYVKAYYDALVKEGRV